MCASKENFGVSVNACLTLRVCMCEREKERERDAEQLQRERNFFFIVFVSKQLLSAQLAKKVFKTSKTTFSFKTVVEVDVVVEGKKGNKTKSHNRSLSS